MVSVSFSLAKIRRFFLIGTNLVFYLRLFNKTIFLWIRKKGFTKLMST